MADDSLPDLDPVELQGYKLEVDYYLKKDYDDISAASQELPALIEWINMMVQCYAEDRLVAKQEIKEAEARAYFRLMKSDALDKKTDTVISRALVLEEDVMKAHRRFARLTGWVSRLQNLQMSFQSKLDLVRSTESTRRSMIDPTQDPETSSYER